VTALEFVIHADAHLAALAGSQAEDAGGRVHRVAPAGLADDVLFAVLGFQQDLDVGVLGEHIGAVDGDVHHRAAGGDAFCAVFVAEAHLGHGVAGGGAVSQLHGDHRHQGLGQGGAAVEEFQAPAVGGEAAGAGEVAEVAADAHPFCGECQVLGVAHALAQQCPVVEAGPVAGGAGAEVAGLGLAVQEEAVVGGDDHLVEALFLESMDGHPQGAEDVGEDAQGGVGVGFQVAVDLGAA